MSTMFKAIVFWEINVKKYAMFFGQETVLPSWGRINTDSRKIKSSYKQDILQDMPNSTYYWISEMRQSRHLGLVQDPQMACISVIFYIQIGDTGIKIIGQQWQFMDNNHFRKNKSVFGNDPGLNPTNFTKALKGHNYIFNCQNSSRSSTAPGSNGNLFKL